MIFSDFPVFSSVMLRMYIPTGKEALGILNSIIIFSLSMLPIYSTYSCNSFDMNSVIYTYTLYVLQYYV